MYIVASHFRVSSFRRRGFVWMLLTILCWGLLPVVSVAQQPTATINILSGTVLVNGQTAAQGAVLSAGDMLETQAGASVVLELSDGSILELGEHTKLDLTVLSQTAAGARTSNVKLWWGRVRATLSAGHQQVGSNFDIETPNALVGVKFSQPDVEVIYDPIEEKTTAFAHTVALWVTNLLTGEKILVPVGSAVIVTALGMQLLEGAAAAGVIAAESTEAATAAAATAAAATAAAGTATGISTGTMIAIGAGALAAAGAGTAVAVSNLGKEEEEEGNVSFSGIFENRSSPGAPVFYLHIVFDLVQNGSTVTGNVSVTSSMVDCCENQFSLPILTGIVEGRLLTFSLPSKSERCPCVNRPEPYLPTDIRGGIYTAYMAEDGNSFNVNGSESLIRAGGTYYRRQ